MATHVTVAHGASPKPVSRRRRWLRRLAMGVGIVLVTLAAAAAYLFLRPVGVDDLDGDPRPAATYEEAMARFADVEHRESKRGDVSQTCRSRVLSGGERASRAIVLIHGYTNCPQQFERLGEELAAAGYNVYIPLMPEHGEVDRERTTLGDLTAEELIAYANESADIAAGLGDEVTVLGLSGGGAVASYLGQFRGDVDTAIAAAPYLSLPWAPEWLVPALVNIADTLPPIGIGTTESAASGSGTYAPYAYFDNNTRSAGAYMKLGQLVLRDASGNPHRAGRTLTILNEADETVNNPMVDELNARWEALDPGGTDEYRFPASLGIPHDMIGPDRVDQRIDVVYPILLDLIEGR